MPRPPKVLLAHNYYRSCAPSGEDTVFDGERRLLERSGVTVVPFVRRNDDIADLTGLARVRLAVDTSWSVTSYRSIRDLIRRERPDIAHFHNTFPQISPSAYSACRDEGVPVVQTLHNFRLICAGALLQREGKPCQECINGSPVFGLLPGLRHRCYRESLPATGAVTMMLAANRLSGAYTRNVDRYIVLTRFAASRLAEAGLPADRMVVKANCLEEAPECGTGSGGYALFVGRLSQEKGVRTLLRAWRHLGNRRLLIVGDGPLREELCETVRTTGVSAEFLGHRPRSEVLDLTRQAAFLIVPSEWFEGFPMVVLEALACGTPVIASRIGSLDEIVDDGVTGAKFRAGDPEGLAEAVRRLEADPDGLARMRVAARATFDREYASEHNLSQLMTIYRDAILSSKHV